MSKLKDLTNQKFGKLTVLERVNDKIHPSGQHSVMWKCQCECGNIITTSSANLRNNHTMSCGCYREKRLYESRKKYNKYDLSNDYGIGIDSKGNYSYFDLEDYDKIKEICWCVDSFDKRVSGCYYGKHIRLHQLVLDFPNQLIDHINRNPSDNRKSNLRLSDKQLNSINRDCNKNSKTQVRGVCKLKNGKYMARTCIDYKDIYLGCFETMEEAKLKREEFKKQYFGEYSYKEVNDEVNN